jgi:hypothetical protein
MDMLSKVAIMAASAFALFSGTCRPTAPPAAVFAHDQLGALSAAVRPTLNTVSNNLIPNGDFELGLVPQCGVQGVLPLPWFQATPTMSGADVYSFDCSQLNGLQPAFANFPCLPAANSGIRFIAAWGSANEVPGTPLVTAPRPGILYELSGYFVRSKPHMSTAPYHVYLSENGVYDPGADLFVGTIGSGSVQELWSVDCLRFAVPRASRPFTHLFLDPEDGQDCYIGVDSLVLRPFHVRHL